MYTTLSRFNYVIYSVKLIFISSFFPSFFFFLQTRNDSTVTVDDFPSQSRIEIRSEWMFPSKTVKPHFFFFFSSSPSLHLEDGCWKDIRNTEQLTWLSPVKWSVHANWPNWRQKHVCEPGWNFWVIIRNTRRLLHGGGLRGLCIPRSRTNAGRVPSILPHQTRQIFDSGVGKT